MTFVVRGGSVDVAVDGGRIVAVGEGLDGANLDDADVLDATGCTVAPGFVDLQCNGAGGFDLTAEPERVAEVAALLPRWGVTAWLPTIVTASADVRARAVEVITATPVPNGAAAVLGVHLEGPFLAPGRTGAHDRRFVMAPVDEGWSSERGVALVTLAPEQPGGLDLVRTLAGRGVAVAVGHSDATAEQVAAAVDAGATLVTHLFNAMSPLHHRAPGVPGAALTDERLRVGMIVDGIHVDPAVVRVAWRAAGERIFLVTDAVAAMGSAGHETGTGVRLADGTLAGSDLTMDQAVRNLVAFAGCTPEQAITAATATPAAAIGAGHRGAIRPGAVADLTVLDRDLQVVATVVRGVVRRW